MSLKSQNLISANTYELEIESTAEEFESAIEKAYKKNRNRINVPGFRKGKATRKMIEKLYGETVFYDDAINSMVPTVIAPAVESTDLELVAQPEIDVTSISKETGVVFKVKCITKPEIKLENYKGITYKPMSLEITDEDVEAEVQKLRERNSRLVTVEGRAAENGDIAVIDFKGILDGEAFEGGTSENYNLTLGSGSFIPGFEDQIIGHNAGEEFTIDVTFPEDYQADNLKGKAVQFEIKLHELKKKELPEFDDDFVKESSEFDTVDSYKADIRKNLEEARQKEAASDKENQVAEKLKELMNAEIPEVMYENQVDNLVDEFEMSLRAQGIDLATYMQYTGLTDEKLHETYYDRAVSQVNVRLALKKIAELEGIKATDEDVENKFKELAEKYKVDINRVKAAFPAEDIASDLDVGKALELVVDAAVAEE